MQSEEHDQLNSRGNTATGLKDTETHRAKGRDIGKHRDRYYHNH